MHRKNPLTLLFAAVFTAHFNYFFTVKRFYQLTIYRLSEKICTFGHSFSSMFWRTQTKLKGPIPANGIGPKFFRSQNF